MGWPTAWMATKPPAGSPPMSRTAGSGVPGHPGAPAAGRVEQGYKCAREPAPDGPTMCCGTALARRRRPSSASLWPARVRPTGAEQLAREGNGEGSGCCSLLSLCLPLPPVDGLWSEWAAWSNCTRDCRGVVVRQRECLPPQNGGRHCTETADVSSGAIEIRESIEGHAQREEQIRLFFEQGGCQ